MVFVWSAISRYVDKVGNTTMSMKCMEMMNIQQGAAFLLVALFGVDLLAGSPVVIAHRGASGYCIEHSEAAKVLAHAQNADYIEQDVVLTKDRVLVVSHDITMEATTNVDEVFPKRRREDGKFYFADFTWSELQSVSLRPRMDRSSGKVTAGPGVACGQKILTLENEIKLLRSLDHALGRKTGLYIELKGPSFYEKELGVKMGELLLDELKRLEVSTDPKDCLIQCFEENALIDLKNRLRCPYSLILLMGGKGTEFDFQQIASYAYGVGPSLQMLARQDANTIVSTGFAEKAKAAGLKLHPYTVRKNSQPSWSPSLDETHRFLLSELRVDGFFTDYPDLGRQAVDRMVKP